MLLKTWIVFPFNYKSHFSGQLLFFNQYIFHVENSANSSLQLNRSSKYLENYLNIINSYNKNVIEMHNIYITENYNRSYTKAFTIKHFQLLNNLNYEFF